MTGGPARRPAGEGPRVVALGGGHGLSTTLRAARTYAGELTAVVSVADDGGSSGRLREALGIPAPGDLRRCLAALGDPAEPLTAALEHRFTAGDLSGHALGNLLIAGLASTLGDFNAALDAVGRLVGAAGRVLPATIDAVVLKAESAEGEVQGQVAVANAGRLTCVSLVPPDPAPSPGVTKAIATADQIIVGPGSLFTSVCAVVAVPAIRTAIAGSRARTVYVSNLREQPPETTGFDVAAHVETLIAHGVDPDVVLYDRAALPVGDLRGTGVAAGVAADLALPGGAAHDPDRLAAALAGLVG